MAEEGTPPPTPKPEETLKYVRDMVTALQDLCIGQQLSDLRYFLEMARLEAEREFRSAAEAEKQPRS